MIRLLNWVLRLGLGGWFIYAGTQKILDPATFALDVTHYRLLPEVIVNLFAITLPWVEVVAGLCLVTGFWRRSSALVIGVLCLVFLVAVAQAMARHLSIDCGCKTFGAQKVGFPKLVELCTLLAVAGWLVWREKRD